MPSPHLNSKFKNEIGLQKKVVIHKKTRRGSVLSKDGTSAPFRIRPSSKKLPPLSNINKESLCKKEILLNKTLLDIPPPFVTSRCWAVINGSNGDLLFGKLEKEVREMASLTKIMVIYTVIKLCQRFQMPLKTSKIQVNHQTTLINGT
jgi:hypothetical protein